MKTYYIVTLTPFVSIVQSSQDRDYLPWLRTFDLDGHEKTLRKALDKIKKYNDPEIVQRIDMWKMGLKTTEDDVLDLLIRLTNSDGSPLLSPLEIKAQIRVLAKMINEPSILEKAVKEIDRVVGRERIVQESDLSSLNYVKACAKEAFRLHPITTFNVTHVSISYTIVAGYFIPKGSHVLISRLTLGRNPNIWQEPLKFNQDRHLSVDDSDVILADAKLELISFSTGRCGCPGVLLGSTMTTMLLARLLQGFNWSKNPNILNYNLSGSRNDLSLAKAIIGYGKTMIAK